MKLGQNTPINTTLGAAISLITVLGMGLLLWTQLASEEYVDDKVREECTVNIEKLEVNLDAEKERSQQLDTAIQLMNQSIESHDKNMEAFTRALEQIRDNKD